MQTGVFEMFKLKILFFMVLTMGVGAVAQARDIGLECSIVVEEDLTKRVVVQDVQDVILKGVSNGRIAKAKASGVDTSVEVFSQVEGTVRNYSMLPFRYYVTPISERSSGSVLVEVGVYRTNFFAPHGREVVYSTTREVRRDEPLEVSFQHKALRILNVDLICYL